MSSALAAHREGMAAERLAVAAARAPRSLQADREVDAAALVAAEAADETRPERIQRLHSAGGATARWPAERWASAAGVAPAAVPMLSQRQEATHLQEPLPHSAAVRMLAQRCTRAIESPASLTLTVQQSRLSQQARLLQLGAPRQQRRPHPYRTSPAQTPPRQRPA